MHMYVEVGIIQDKDIFLVHPSECLFFDGSHVYITLDIKKDSWYGDLELADNWMLLLLTHLRLTFLWTG